MPDSSDFALNLTADVSEFVAGMDEAKDSASAAGEEIKGSIEEGGSGEALAELGEQSKEALEKFTALGEGLKGIAEVMGAGFLGEAITKTMEEFVELGSEVQRTATIMGTSNAEAHAWVDAAELSGMSANTFTQASRAMNAQVLAGGKQLKEMGISLTDANGAMKTTEQLIEDTINTLDTYTASVNRNALAQKTLGRGWIDMVANGQTLLTNLEQQKEEFANVGSSEDQLVGQTKALQAANAQMKISWDAIVTSSGPALNVLLKGVAESLAYVEYMAKSATAAVQSLFSVAGQLAGVMQGITQITPGGGDISTNQEDVVSGYNKIQASIKAAGDEANKFSDIQQHLDAQFEERRSNIWKDNIKQYTDQLKNAGSAPAPPANIPKGGGKGGGGADPMAGMDDTLVSSQNAMDKMAGEMQKLGTEAQMAAKASQESFETLKDRATNDYKVMTDAHKAFATAVQAGDVEAAKASEKDWHDAAQKFQQDWEAAKQKATQDMQQIKSMADQMAGEVSSVLNNAISGKLNWAQEFNSILEKMLSSLIKHLFQQVALWAQNAAQVNAVRAAGAAAGLAQQKAANTAAGTSDAVTAAKGAYSSAAQIPFIGWIIAPMAAAAAFSGVEAFGSAEGGFDVPPGVSPMTQLHPREMVLPADIAGGMRRMIAGGGGGGSTSVTQNIHAIDSKSFLDIVDSNHQGIAQAVAKARRGGGRFNMG